MSSSSLSFLLAFLTEQLSLLSLATRLDLRGGLLLCGEEDEEGTARVDAALGGVEEEDEDEEEPLWDSALDASSLVLCVSICDLPWCWLLW